MARWARNAIVAVMALGCSACLEKCAPNRVAQGVSQLTIRNFGSIVEAVNEDTECGFESDDVKASFIQNGESGTNGEVIYVVESCVIDVPRDTPSVNRDCNDVATAVAGKVTVTANRHLRGYLTGDPKQPVIPEGPDAVTIDVVKATFEDFQVDSSDTPEFMVMKSGSISGKLSPQLAAAADTGVCSIPTRNVVFSDIEYENASVRVVTKSRDFIVPVATSNLSAVNGRVGDRENVLSGTITVWGSAQDVPRNSKKPELNPDYDADQHLEGFACTDNLEVPVNTTECVTDIRPLIAQGASQLSIQTIGRLARHFDEDTNCGFASDAVNSAVQITGETGVRGGSGTWTVSTPCVIEFAPGTVLDTDCNGVSVYASGTVRMTGTKTVNGIPSGDPAEPVVPTTRDPALVELQADFSDFSLWAGDGTNKLSVASGQLAAKIHPRVAKDSVKGACSIKTPNSGFSNVAWTDAKVTVESDGSTFSVNIDGSNLTAQNGTKGERTNYLAGSIILDGEPFTIPTGSNPVLDPEYDEASFNSSYACTENMEIATSDADCDMYETLAEGAGRLLVRATGAISSLVNDSKDCGFENLLVKLRPSQVTGSSGQLGSMEWEISGCSVGGGSGPYQTDCVGVDKYVSGEALVDAKRTVRGEREKVIDIGSIQLIDSIKPLDRTSVDIELQDVELRDFFNEELRAGETISDKALRVVRGQLSATVKPVTGENAKKSGRFDISTPVAHMTGINLRNADVEIFFEGKMFKLHIDSTNIEAFNGSYDQLGMTNMIKGTVTVGDRQITYPAGAGLDPDFEQKNFDASYSCTEDLVSIVPY